MESKKGDRILPTKCELIFGGIDEISHHRFAPFLLRSSCFSLVVHHHSRLRTASFWEKKQGTKPFRKRDGTKMKMRIDLSLWENERGDNHGRPSQVSLLTRDTAMKKAVEGTAS